MEKSFSMDPPFGESKSSFNTRNRILQKDRLRSFTEPRDAQPLDEKEDSEEENSEEEKSASTTLVRAVLESVSGPVETTRADEKPYREQNDNETTIDFEVVPPKVEEAARIKIHESLGRMKHKLEAANSIFVETGRIMESNGSRNAYSAGSELIKAELNDLENSLQRIEEKNSEDQSYHFKSYPKKSMLEKKNLTNVSKA